MKLVIDFSGNEVEYEDDGAKGIIVIDDLPSKKEAVLSALGLKEKPMEDLRNEIDTLFVELGLNVECARPKEDI